MVQSNNAWYQKPATNDQDRPLWPFASRCNQILPDMFSKKKPVGLGKEWVLILKAAQEER
jgi:hypothetical protein